jgi:hypothetical protein
MNRDFERDRDRNMGPGLLEQQPHHHQNQLNHQNHGYGGRGHGPHHMQNRFGQGRMHHEHHHHHHRSEEEPEWFTGGPTSQNEMIELHGFDDEVEDISKAPKKTDLGGEHPWRRINYEKKRVE